MSERRISQQGYYKGSGASSDGSQTPSSYQDFNAPEVTRRTNTMLHMTMERARLEADRFEKQPLMGRAWRSPITGEITMRDFHFPDFHLVDLWTRDQICCTEAELLDDMYVFRARPMAYRSWIYHHMYREKVVIPESKDDMTSIENRLLKHVLMQMCIDKKISAGRWSSLMCSVPFSMAACLTSDIPLMVYGIFICSLIYVCTIKICEPSWYRIQRLVTFLPRVSLLAFFAYRVPIIMEETFSFLALIGMTIMVCCIVIDFYVGDVETLRCYRWTCRYDIIKTLPNRVFVVQQTGGMIGFNKEGSYSRDQRLTVMGSLDPSYRLVADIEGLLVHLDPVDPKTARALKLQIEDSCMRDDHIGVTKPKFLGMDVFDPKLRSIQEIQSAEQQKDMISQMMRSKTGVNSDDVHVM